MNNEQTKEALKEELELLRKENEQLKRQLRSLEQNKQPEESSTSFQERYAVKILNSLPDMLTVFNHNEAKPNSPEQKEVVSTYLPQIPDFLMI